MEMIGRLISGRYRLIAPLGDGGMATIWRAVDEQLDREVAVKLLRPQFSADPGFTARFKQEARSAGGLTHPNIVSVYDYGTDGADGDQYIVMELVEGRDLSAILADRGTLSTDDAVRIAIAVASALATPIATRTASSCDSEPRSRRTPDRSRPSTSSMTMYWSPSAPSVP